MQIRNSNISPFSVRDYPVPEMGCLRFGVTTDFKKEGKEMMRFAA